MHFTLTKIFDRLCINWIFTIAYPLEQILNLHMAHFYKTFYLKNSNPLKKKKKSLDNDTDLQVFFDMWEFKGRCGPLIFDFFLYIYI